MKVLKDDKYKSILSAARQEFISKGFKDASMRTIAKNANVCLSNIYNYFQNKDEIFVAIVKPAKDKLFSFVTEQHKEEYLDLNLISPFGHDEKAMDHYIELICTYKKEYRLLLYQSQGSSMESFRDMLTNHMTHVSYDFMEMEKKRYPDANKISHFFIHTMSSWMVSILGEIVTHELERKKIHEFFREYFRFSFTGWRELVGI